VIRRAIAYVAAATLAWAVLVFLTGGTTIAIAALRVSSTDPIRPMLASVLLAAVYALASGRQRLREDAAFAANAATPARLTIVLAAVALVIAIAQSSYTASGADAYAYVTQADLMLSGRLTVPVPIANEVPWPRPLSTFVPFGYAAVANDSAIASAVGPGLPLLMAVFKAIAGHAALFLVVPITAALLIWCTFAIGRHLWSPDVGLGAAWLTATSPVVLTMLKEPMSDVPAAAFWALATWKAFDASRVSTALAGAAAAVAILIRPNLVPLAAVLGIWMLVRPGHVTVADRVRALAIFAAAVVPACLLIAWINQTLFGSPLTSGYGVTEQLFASANAWPNLRRFGGWLVDTQTLLFPLGFLALLGRARLLAAITIVTAALYAFYIPFNAWWFLRLLLPAWPALALGTVSLIQAVSRLAGSRARLIQAVAVAGLGLFTAYTAGRLRVFPDNEGERRYATIADLVRQATEPSSLILASIHTGPIRYYAGRDTMRFDLLNEEWLDRAVAWLAEHGRHPYFLIEDWERPIFEKRFAALNSLGRLAMSPVLAYRAYGIPGTVYLFDPAKPSAITFEPAPIRDPRPRCLLPSTPPLLALKTRF